MKAWQNRIWNPRTSSTESGEASDASDLRGVYWRVLHKYPKAHYTSLTQDLMLSFSCPNTASFGWVLRKLKPSYFSYVPILLQTDSWIFNLHPIIEYSLTNCWLHPCLTSRGNTPAWFLPSQFSRREVSTGLLILQTASVFWMVLWSPRLLGLKKREWTALP